MRRAVIVAWVLGVCTGLRKSRAKTLAELAAAAVTTRRAGLANLGRAMAGAVRRKHRIKRAARFVANRRVTVADGMAGVIERPGLQGRAQRAGAAAHAADAGGPVRPGRADPGAGVPPADRAGAAGDGGRSPGDWSSRDKGTPCSAAMVGRAMLGRFRLAPAAAVAAILAATIAAAQKWG